MACEEEVVEKETAHLPVLNNVEHVWIKKDGAFDVARVHIPAVVVPEANWSTLLHRFKQWSAAGFGPGRPVEHHELRAAFLGSRVHCHQLTKDSLVGNQCIVGKLQRDALARRSGTNKYDLFWDIDCRHHGGALCNRPVLKRIPGISTALVKMAHLLESGRSMEAFLKGLDSLVDHGDYQYRRVYEYPPEYIEWQREARRVLELSRVALDLTDADLEAILEFDNFPWESETLGALLPCRSVQVL